VSGLTRRPEKEYMNDSNSRDPSNIKLERSIEALLFASDSPLSISRIAAITGADSTKDIRAAIESIDRFYRDNRRSFEIVEIAGGFQITTLPEHAQIVAQLFKNRRKSRLSQPALETLAIVAYKQPICRTDIETIRGVNSEGVLSTLVDRELIQITGRGEGVGRPYLYSTTRKFLEYLGLKDHRDLPSVEELEKTFIQQEEYAEPGPACAQDVDAGEESRSGPGHE
jgi:segregation and condensation protein B